ncbi:unnamed protein product [Pleuronectes platessa]|uniref:H15 domain-containing protein n=1 Tax=Pleuronectes platessa TaxID=8262 RepID=A0A9N7UAQ3_PLEPL|nr:unnamed protein product [Pleuronectes platessa]
MRSGSPRRSKSPKMRAKSPKRRAKPQGKKSGFTVSNLILEGVSASTERHRMSLAALKKALQAGGYDVARNNARVLLTIRRLVANKALVQNKVTSGSFKFRETPAGFKAPAGTRGALLGLKSPRGATRHWSRGRTKQHPVEEDQRRFIPLRSKTNPLLFGPADAAATEEPAPPSLSGHDHLLDFRNIRATRACNTVKVTRSSRRPKTTDSFSPSSATDCTKLSSSPLSSPHSSPSHLLP